MSLSYILLNDSLETFRSGFTKTNIAIANTVVNASISGDTFIINKFNPDFDINVSGLTTINSLLDNLIITGNTIDSSSSIINAFGSLQYQINQKENLNNKVFTMSGNTTSDNFYLTTKGTYDWATNLFIEKNLPITGNTNTKITYDSKGLVISSTSATTEDILESEVNLYFKEERVLSTKLNGLSISGSPITTNDSILSAFGALQYQLNNLFGGIIYRGTWDASTNIPTLTSSTGTQGDYYVVSNSGTTNLDGITDWKISDWVIFNGTIWEKIDNTDSVLSINGHIGNVILTGATNKITVNNNIWDISENYSGQTSIETLGTITTGIWNGSSISDNYISSSTIWNNKQNQLSGTGFVKISGTTISYDDNIYLTSAITSLNSLTSSSQTLVTGNTGNDFNISSVGSTHTFNIPTASSANTRGLLSSTDWSTFNNKQNSLDYIPEDVANKSTDGTFASNSDTLYPSEKATKTYVDSQINTINPVGSKLYLYNNYL